MEFLSIIIGIIMGGFVFVIRRQINRRIRRWRFRIVIVNVTINIDKPFSNQYLKLRHTIEDTLESRKLAEVLGVGIGEKFMDLKIRCSKIKLSEIKLFISTLGIEALYKVNNINSLDLDNNERNVVSLNNRSNIKPGDIFEVKLKTPKKYFQFVLRNDDYMGGGYLIRSFNYECAMEHTPQIDDIVNSGITAYIYTWVKNGVKEGVWERVGNNPIERDFEMPYFAAFIKN